MVRARYTLPANTTGAALSSVASNGPDYYLGGGLEKSLIGGLYYSGAGLIYRVQQRREQDMRQQDFKALERYPNGDIVDLYPIHHLLTEKQQEQLTCDDWSRVEEYQAEIDFELNCLLEELRTA